MTQGVRGLALALVAALLALVPVVPAPAATPPAHVRAELRVNQQGWLPRETKTAVLMASRPLGHTTFAVVGKQGRVFLRGTVPSGAAGTWSKRFPDVYRLDLSALRAKGRYRVVTAGAVRVTSPHFRISGSRDLYGPLVDYGVRFDQNQRDGDEQVAGPLGRKPAHLNDAAADVYAWPHMVRGEDLITDPDLTKIGGPVDVEGGWADAGDYLKFTHSSAYNDVVLFTSARLLGTRAPQSLVDEARYGVTWLDKMWDESSLTLHLQVGLGSGNKQGTFIGDHDGWRLPEVDDHDTDPLHRYVAHRPVLDAALAGQPISPNLAGRVSAAFALASQQEADPVKALALLGKAQGLYARAATTAPPKPLVTALPHAFYPESVWQDDMELGGAEIARAAQRLGLSAAPYLASSAHWAKRYLKLRSGDRQAPRRARVRHRQPDVPRGTNELQLPRRGIPGTDKADEVVMLGGHLDSWHAATGATDNAIGCSVMMEAARIFSAIGVKPRRTIRCRALEWGRAGSPRLAGVRPRAVRQLRGAQAGVREAGGVPQHRQRHGSRARAGDFRAAGVRHDLARSDGIVCRSRAAGRHHDPEPAVGEHRCVLVRCRGSARRQCAAGSD